jgi:Flp pilus assembly secretin CpaC
VLNNKQAKFHIGDRIPIQTSTIQSITQTQAVTSTFEYKDVGIKLNIEPTIHLNNTVTMKMGLEISNLGDAIDFGNNQKQYKSGPGTPILWSTCDGESEYRRADQDRAQEGSGTILEIFRSWANLLILRR